MTSEAKTIARFLKVNHAGEYGATRIYGAQIAMAKWLHPKLVEFLEDTLRHEHVHLARFRALMPTRNTRPCGAMQLWGIGGSVLGLFTGALGHDAILICTEAVERTVHAHLNAQLSWLGGRDPEFETTIREIRDEEIGHLNGAIERRGDVSIFAKLLDQSIANMTWLLIWFSTYGAESHVTKTLKKMA